MSDPYSPLESPSFSRRENTGITRREAIVRTLKAGAGISVLTQMNTFSSAAPLPETRAVASLPEKVTLTLNINGRDHTLSVEPRVTLLDALRDHLGMTGTKKGCDHGQCGACTLLVNGRRIDSCLTLAVMHRGDAIITIEGLADGEKLSPVQAAFIKHDAFQCGYCTPGQICSATALIREGHAKTDADIREQMAGNLCRCGAYQHIVSAVREAMQSPPA
jgi:xanthine dehydrogenase YagT iron-sulfur-binding subunit